VLRIRGAAAAALAALCAVAPTAVAHKGNPNYRSEVQAISPAIVGLEAQVLNYDDRIELRNDSGETVVVEGYRGEPYLRFGPDGTVEVNTRSPAAYLNEDRFAAVDVPARADPEAEPEWETVARNGRYDWHDHRIHWMSKTPPERVSEDEATRVKVFDWKLPVTTASQGATISGSLTWLGEEGGGFPLVAALSLGLAVLVGGALVLLVRRRRRGAGASRPKAEAW
jgi:hypothetical protein